MGKRARLGCCGGSSIAFLLGVGLIVAGLVVVLKVVPDQVDDTIKKDKVLIKYPNGTYNDFTKDWVKPKYKSTMQYWVYDYKNPISVINRGQLPDVDEKGPYAYREETENTITWISDDQNVLQYTQTIRYVFDPSQSCLGCDPYKDTVLVPDISYIVGINAFTSFDRLCGFLYQLDNGTLCDLLQPLGVGALYDADVVPLLGDVFDLYKTGPFVRVTVDELLISGYSANIEGKLIKGILQTLMDIIKVVLPFLYGPLPDFPTVKVSYGQTLYYTSPHYEISTGKEDYTKVGFIRRFTMVDSNNKTISTEGSLLPKQWWFSNCSEAIKARELQGSTGDYFPSFLKKTDVVSIYVDSVCRSLNLEYEKEVTVREIDGYRFILPAKQFDWSNPDNCGFCFPLAFDFYNKHTGDASFPNGLLDVSGCQGGNPVAISKPHFYQADPIVQNFVPRFKPGYDDEIMIDVEPKSGTILAANKRLQVNLMANQFKNISSMSVFRPGAYPIFWLNESFYADDDTIKDIKSDLIDKVRTYRIVCYSAVGVGGLLLVLSLLSIFGIAFLSKRKNE